MVMVSGFAMVYDQTVDILQNAFEGMQCGVFKVITLVVFIRTSIVELQNCFCGFVRHLRFSHIHGNCMIDIGNATYLMEKSSKCHKNLISILLGVIFTVYTVHKGCTKKL